MSEHVVKRTTDRTKVRTMAQVAMLGAVATVLMALDFPIPFLAPPFYQMDFSEIPVLVGAFAMGPLAGVAIEFLKVVLHMLLQGTSTAGVGDLANFLVGCAYMIPAAMIYRTKKTRGRALVGLGVGTVTMVLVGCVMNAFVLLPAYAAAFQVPVQSFIDMGAEINPAINSLFRFCLLAVGPFNLVKGLLTAAITLIIYKKISILLKGNLE